MEKKIQMKELKKIMWKELEYSLNSMKKNKSGLDEVRKEIIKVLGQIETQWVKRLFIHACMEV